MVALRAWFSGLLAEHGGTAFEFELAFSAEVRRSYWKRKDGSTFERGRVDDDVGGGDAERADRLAGTGGFFLAFRADALWVGAASDLLDGPTGRLNASEAG